MTTGKIDPVQIAQEYGIKVENSVYPEEWTYLYQAAQSASKILEIGSYKHFSTLAFLKAMEGNNTSLLTLDINYRKELVYKDSSVMNRWIKLEMSSFDVLPNLKCKFDLILIDGNHRATSAEKDLRNSLPLIDNGIILIHDINYRRVKIGIRRVIDKKYTVWRRPGHIGKLHGFGIVTIKNGEIQ